MGGYERSREELKFANSQQNNNEQNKLGEERKRIQALRRPR